MPFRLIHSSIHLVKLLQHTHSFVMSDVLFQLLLIPVGFPQFRNIRAVAIYSCILGFSSAPQSEILQASYTDVRATKSLGSVVNEWQQIG